MSARGVRQLNAERWQGEGFPTSIVRHGESVSYVGVKEEGEVVVELL